MRLGGVEPPTPSSEDWRSLPTGRQVSSGNYIHKRARVESNLQRLAPPLANELGGSRVKLSITYYRARRDPSPATEFMRRDSQRLPPPLALIQADPE